MRYFTRGWANGDLSDEEWERARAAYSARVDEIAPLLPPAMLRLVRELSLHDAVIDEVRWSPSLGRLCLRLACIAEESRYFGVELVYGGAMLGTSRIESIRRAALDRETELLYDEVDIDPEGTLTHRFLLSPREEVSIDFRSLELTTWERSDRRVHLGPGFLEELADEPDGE